MEIRKVNHDTASMIRERIADEVFCTRANNIDPQILYLGENEITALKVMMKHETSVTDECDQFMGVKIIEVKLDSHIHVT